MMQFKYCLLFLLCAVTFSFGQRNPFRAPSADTVAAVSKVRSPEHRKCNIRNAFWKRLPFSGAVMTAQRGLTAKLSRSLNAVKGRYDPAAVAGLLLLAFIYGIIHSIGPGHAKTLFISHGLTGATPVRQTWIAGALFAFAHTGMAILLFVVLRKLLGLGQTDSESYSAEFMTLSGILIMVAGVVVIISPFIEKAAQSAVGAFIKKTSGLSTLAVAAGIAPCPGAFLILSFANIIGVFHIGIAAVIAVSLGMMITVSIAGMLGGLIGTAAAGKTGRPAWKYVNKIVRSLAGAIIISIGALMALGE